MDDLGKMIEDAKTVTAKGGFIRFHGVGRRRKSMGHGDLVDVGIG